MGLGRILPFPATHHLSSDTRSIEVSKHISLLSIGRDTTILKKRESSLKRAGYQVRTLKVRSFLSERIVESTTFAVFCHTLAAEECLFLASHFRRYAPASRLILLTRGDDYRLESVLFHATVRIEDGPRALRREIERLAEPQKHS
jgi:hypothetical protein